MYVEVVSQYLNIFMGNNRREKSNLICNVCGIIVNVTTKLKPGKWEGVHVTFESFS